MFLGFNLHAWITILTVLSMFSVLQWIVKHLLGHPKSYSDAVARLMVPVAALSSFLSNTTVVALFVNIVYSLTPLQ